MKFIGNNTLGFLFLAIAIYASVVYTADKMHTINAMQQFSKPEETANRYTMTSFQGHNILLDTATGDTFEFRIMKIGDDEIVDGRYWKRVQRFETPQDEQEWVKLSYDFHRQVTE